MITEDYVSFETAKLLKKKGFKSDNCHTGYDENGSFFWYGDYSKDRKGVMDAPTLQMAMKWLREVHNILLIPDYDYECTDKSWCYKIYQLGEHGKPERVAVNGVSYDKNDNPTTHLVGWRDYERSYGDYGTYEEACEAAIKYVLKI